MYMTKLNVAQINDFEDELFDCYLDVLDVNNPQAFESITLHLKTIERKRKSCPKCNKEMEASHFNRHLKSCIEGSYCPVCQTEIGGILQLILSFVEGKTIRAGYAESLLLQETGEQHMKKCRVTGEAGPSKKSWKDGGDRRTVMIQR